MKNVVTKIFLVMKRNRKEIQAENLKKKDEFVSLINENKTFYRAK